MVDLINVIFDVLSIFLGISCVLIVILTIKLWEL